MPYLILALIWAASLVGVGYWQNGAGHIEERTLWQEKEAIELRQANEKIIEQTAEARAKEKTHAAALVAISAGYQRRLIDATKQRAADATAIRTGTLRLRDPGSPSLNPAGCGLPEAGPSAGGRDGRAAGELSEPSTEFLLDLANDADQVADQLAACQRVVRADLAM